MGEGWRGQEPRPSRPQWLLRSNRASRIPDESDHSSQISFKPFRRPVQLDSRASIVIFSIRTSAVIGSPCVSCKFQLRGLKSGGVLEGVGGESTRRCNPAWSPPPVPKPHRRSIEFRRPTPAGFEKWCVPGSVRRVLVRVAPQWCECGASAVEVADVKPGGAPGRPQRSPTWNGTNSPRIALL
jgi:hypothetical protein